MEEEVEIHASREVVKVVHEEDDPEECESFEGVDDVPQLDDSWPHYMTIYVQN